MDLGIFEVKKESDEKYIVITPLECKEYVCKSLHEVSTLLIRLLQEADWNSKQN